MNRSLTNVLFGGITTQAQSQRKIEGQVTQTSIEDTVEALVNAENVIIVSTTVRNGKRFSLTYGLGCGIWYGGGKGPICHIRNHPYVEDQGDQREIRHPPGRRSNARPMQCPPC